jgi:hypothetical protein
MAKSFRSRIDAKLTCGEDQTGWARVNASPKPILPAESASDPAWNGIADDWHKNARAAV